MAGWRPPFSLRRALPALNVASRTLGGMRTRIVIGTGAWLLGAAAATAGGLLVVSELGEGISASPASHKSSAAAEQAQASQAVAPPSSPASRSQAGASGNSGTGGAGGAGGSGGRTASTSGTVLSSSGGTVVAQC